MIHGNNVINLMDYFKINYVDYIMKINNVDQTNLFLVDIKNCCKLVVLQFKK